MTEKERKVKIAEAVDTFIESVAQIIENKVQKNQLSDQEANVAIKAFQELGDLKESFVAILLETPEIMLAELNRGFFNKSANDALFPSMTRLLRPQQDALSSQDTDDE